MDGDTQQLLIFDPSTFGPYLRRDLMSGKGWQRHIKRGVHTLSRHSAFELLVVNNPDTYVGVALVRGGCTLSGYNLINRKHVFRVVASFEVHWHANALSGWCDLRGCEAAYHLKFSARSNKLHAAEEPHLRSQVSREALARKRLFMEGPEENFAPLPSLACLLPHVILPHSTVSGLPKNVNTGATLYEQKGPGPLDWIEKR